MSKSENNDHSTGLQSLLRHLGRESNFAIIKALLEHKDNPTGLAKRLNWSHSTIRSQVRTLEKLGFLKSQNNGGRRIYSIANEFPSLNHELLVTMIDMAEDKQFEKFSSADSDPLNSEQRERVQRLEQKRTRLKIDYLLSYMGHPGVTSIGQEQAYIKDQIKKITDEIQALKLNH